ncbi:serine/threonine-protein kinase [Bacillus oleivorans]|uniref:Serine/threonine-protein kinase n=1 Tax=Bacillus oleivorans TaxID=1448271 RepID=A0A285D796_9BACI|nr:serine/threonine-protein kinase [Bacillus oleivorans]
MNPTMKSPFKLPPGTVIQGKWHQETYRIKKELGFGANGTVYLAETSGHLAVAIKLSTETSIVASEVNVLKALAKVQGSTLGPSLYDVDDWEVRGISIPFYTMEYIKGKDMIGFIQERGSSWIMVLIIQLLNDLHELHQLGWVFGDLKPENLMVSGPPPRIRCVDVGGTTQIGRSIKEFTEFYDRGYWGLGSRKAEPSYDLFAVVMVILTVYYGGRFEKKGGSLSIIKKKIEGIKELRPFEAILVKAIKGEFQSALEMRKALLTCKSQKQISVAANTAGILNNPANAAQNSPPSRYQKRKKRKVGSFLETVLLVAVVAAFYTLYLVYEIMGG